MPKRLSAAAFYGLALTLGALDQIAKAIVVAKLPLGEVGTIPLWRGVFHFTHTQNTGMAFSLLENQRWILIAAALVVMGVIVASERRARQRPEGLPLLYGLGLCLPFGGAIGNLIDRMRLGYVTDFLDLRLINFPIFNLADSCITVGIVLLAWRSLLPAGEATPAPASENA